MYCEGNRFAQIILITTLMIFLAQGFGSSLWAASAEEERVAKLVAGAKKEGMLVVYTNTPIPSMEPLFKRFNEKYPFIKIDYYRAGAPSLMNKIVTEAQAGLHKFDYVETEGTTGYLMMKRGLFAKYISPESKTFPAQAKDPEGYWTSVYSNIKVISYNTRLVAAKDAPKSWGDLLLPKWKGKLLMGSNDYEWFANMLHLMGEEKGMAFMKNLSMHNPQMRGGHTLIATLLIAGERPIGVASNADMIEQLKTKGAPLDWVGAEPVIYRIHPIAVAQNAQHPNAARLFIDFSLSREGQTLVNNSFRVPDRPDVKPFSANLADKSKVSFIDLSLADHYQETTKKFNSLFIKRN